MLIRMVRRVLGVQAETLFQAKRIADALEALVSMKLQHETTLREMQGSMAWYREQKKIHAEALLEKDAEIERIQAELTRTLDSRTVYAQAARKK